MSDSGFQSKVAAVGLAGVVVFVSTFGNDLQEHVVNLFAPLANALTSSGTVSASGMLLAQNGSRALKAPVSTV